MPCTSRTDRRRRASRRPIRLTLVLICLMAAGAAATPAPAWAAEDAGERRAAAAAAGAKPPKLPSAGRWLTLRTPGFLVIGNAGERNLRQVAERLEQFRDAFAALFPKAVRAVSRPITVIVFRNHRDFEPFKPVHGGQVMSHIAGYYQPGRAVDHIALTTEGSFDYGIIYHEYVHVLVNGIGSVPTWFNEGLAEYYRTFESDGRQRAKLGLAPASHVWLLRSQWLSLEALLTADRHSPYYNERDKASVFYAQSWALVHYLLLADKQKYAGRVAPFLQRLMDGEPVDQACREALQVPAAVLARDVRSYIEQDLFPSQMVRFTDRLPRVDRVPAVPLPDATAHAALGSLLLHMGRADAARGHLEAALALDATHTAAHASLGRLLADAGQREAGLVHLERAVSGPGADWLTYYTYASALREAGAGGDAGAADAARDRALRTALELNPDFTEGYAELAWLHLGTPGREQETEALARQALDRAPGEERYLYLYAAVLTRHGRHAEAGPLLRRLAISEDEWTRRSSADLLQWAEERERQRLLADTMPPPGPEGSTAAPPGLEPALRAPLDGERRASGTLTAIECAGQAIRLVLTVDGEPARVRVRRFEDVEFITYRDDLRGQVECGPRRSQEPVIVTYRAGDDPETLGDAVAVEFMPDGYTPRR